MKKISLLFALINLSVQLMAQVRLPKIFCDNMVLQRERTIPVWGWAGANEKVTVKLNNQSKTIKANKEGKWRIDLPAENAGGPYTLTVSGKNTLSISNILIGDVWVCSGQSNMEMKIGKWGFINNYQQEIAAANYPDIRQFIVPHITATSPQDDIKEGEWLVCSPNNAAQFSATAYFFARELQQKTGVPIGLVNTSWGGTNVETWISKESFENSEEFKSIYAGKQQIDFDELLKQKVEKFNNTLKKLQPAPLPQAAEIEDWKENSFNDSGWNKMMLPGLWEEQGLEGFDGIIWFRKTIYLSAADIEKAAVLELSMIDDLDETFINGVKVGSSIAYNDYRKYNVPAAVLKEGKNVIAIKITDTGGGGGMYGEAENIKIILGDKEFPLSGSWLFSIESIRDVALQLYPNSYPALLYNGMINPLIPFSIKGAIWYQGEANAGRAYQYRTSFPLMINDWRKHWGQGDFPFYFVQLASWNSNNGNSQKGSEWAELREAQTLTLALPNTGMAVTTDIGDAKDIHPKNKQDVGKRLAAIALNKTYNKGNVYAGATYQSFAIDANKITITYSSIGSGLMVKDKYGYIKGFEIAGADKIFHYAQAFVIGEKIIVSSNEVQQPVAVRYGWADDAGENNVFNKEGFPAAPFRTDNWKGITEGLKYKVGDN